MKPYRVSVYLDEKEYKEICQLADEIGHLSLSGLCRMIISFSLNDGQLDLIAQAIRRRYREKKNE